MALKIVAKRSMLVILCYQPQLRAWAIVVLLYCNKFKNIFMFQVASCKDIFFTDPSSLVGHWENFNSNYIFEIICFPYCAKLSLWNDFHKLNGSEAQLWGWWRDWVEKFFFQDTGRKWCFVAAIHKNPITRITAITKIGATKYNSVYVGPRLSGSEGLLVYCIIPPVVTVENKEQKFKYYRTSIEVTSHLRRCHLGKNLNVCWFH